MNWSKAEVLSGLAQWIITGIVALSMILLRRHKAKTDGPPWQLTHKNGEYWELTRLHEVKAKILRIDVSICDTPTVVNNAGFPPVAMDKGDTLMLKIREDLAGPFNLSYVTGKFKKSTMMNELWGQFPKNAEIWTTGVWSTKTSTLQIDATESILMSTTLIYRKIKLKLRSFKKVKAVG